MSYDKYINSPIFAMECHYGDSIHIRPLGNLIEEMLSANRIEIWRKRDHDSNNGSFYITSTPKLREMMRR